MLLIILAGIAAQDVPASASAPATAETKTSDRKGKSDYVDVEAGVGYSTNPLLRGDLGLGQGFGRISVRGVHTRYTERSLTSLSAYGENVTYLGRYGSQQLISVAAHHDRSLSETWKVFGDLDASLDRSGQLSTRFIGFPTTIPTDIIGTPTLPDIQNVDVALNGRTYRFSGQLGAVLKLTPRDNWSFRGGYSRSTFRSNTLDSTTSDFFGSVGYDRLLDERTTVGSIVTVRHSDYDPTGNARVVTPQVTVRKSFSERTTLSGALGVSFARIDNGLTVRNSTGISANASLCRAGQGDSLCISVARDQQASSISGPVTSTSSSIGYFRTIDANQSIQLSASVGRYTRTDDTFLSPLSVGNSTYLNAAGSYSRKLGSRWYSGLNVSARKLYLDGPDPKADASGSVFLRYRFGDLG